MILLVGITSGLAAEVTRRDVGLDGGDGAIPGRDASAFAITKKRTAATALGQIRREYPNLHPAQVLPPHNFNTDPRSDARGKDTVFAMQRCAFYHYS